MLRSLVPSGTLALVATTTPAQVFTDHAAFQASLGNISIQDFDGFAHGTVMPATLPGLRFLGRRPSIYGEQTFPSGGAWHTAPNVLFNSPPDPITIVFEPPVHGAGFFNTSIADRERLDLCACDGSPLFTGELAQGAVNFLGFVSARPIAFLRVTPIAPTNGTIFIDTLTFGFNGPAGSCLPSGPVTAACVSHNGSNVNPSHYTCTSLPVIGAVWQTRIGDPATGSTLLTAVVYSLAGPLPAPVLCQTMMPACSGLEVLVAGPFASSISVSGTFDVGLPCAVDLLGTVVWSQGLRFERWSGVDYLAPLNALEATIGY
jgi:hypothetical protein